MSLKPVVLLYDLDNSLVDECAKLIGKTGLYTTINTYNESNALEALHQYDRGFGFITNKLSCVITGWNSYKKPRDQLLFRMRSEEKRSPLRNFTPVIIVTEDHRQDLKELALDPRQTVMLPAICMPMIFRKALLIACIKSSLVVERPS
jgi:hypothetical protein